MLNSLKRKGNQCKTAKKRYLRQWHELVLKSKLFTVSVWITECLLRQHIYLLSVSGTLQRSCAGLYHSGVNESGVYYISAANIPVTVSCDMTRDLRASGVDSSHNVKTGVTIVSHNLRAQTQIRGKGLEDLKKIITYRYEPFR